MVTSPQHEDDNLRGLAGWLIFIVLSIFFGVLAFWFIRSVDDVERSSSGGGTSMPAAEDSLAGDVESELLRLFAAGDISVDPADLSFSVVDGRVEISGLVASDAERAAIGDALLALAGITGVDDGLTVSSARPEGDDAEQGAGGDAEPEAPERTDDDVLADLLALYDELGIEGAPEPADGVWFLRGIAPDDAAKAALAGAVRRVDGVNRTRNEVIVAGTVGSPVTDASTIVEVEAGQVVLRGAVPTEDAKAAVLAAAQSVFGAGNVVDELIVDPAAEGRIVVVGDVASSLQERLSSELGAAASSLGLTFDDQAMYVELTAEQRALQEELDAAVADVVINFASGSSELSVGEAAKLTPVIEVLTGAADVLVAVEGHTDDQGDAADNQVLSQERAQSVVDYMVGQGVDASLLRAAGNGESQPVADNTTADGRAQNRRTEFRVVV